jgi:hypothetical protein
MSPPLLTLDFDFTELLPLRVRLPYIKIHKFSDGLILCFVLPQLAAATSRASATGLLAHDIRESLTDEVTGRGIY